MSLAICPKCDAEHHADTIHASTVDSADLVKLPAPKNSGFVAVVAQPVCGVIGPALVHEASYLDTESMLNATAVAFTLYRHKPTALARGGPSRRARCGPVGRHDKAGRLSVNDRRFGARGGALIV